MLRRPGAAPEGRAHVALRGGRQRGDRRGDPGERGVPRRDARAADRRARARAAGRADRVEVTISPRATRSTSRRRCRGSETQEIYTLHGSAVAGPIVVPAAWSAWTATGMTACPCAQTLVSGELARTAASKGFSDDEIERVFQAVPVATHNQRGIGTLRDRLPRGLRDRHRRARARHSRSSRPRCRRRSTS